MKKGDILTGTVTKVRFPNRGTVLLEKEDGSTVNCAVKNVLPGQKVNVRISKTRNGNPEGACLEVLERSPVEVEADCPHFGSCGGCIYRTLPYKEQLKLKSEQVKSLLDQALAEQDERWSFEPIKGSPLTVGYRNKMEFSFGDEVKDGPLSLGMHKRGSFYDIVTVSDCQIIDPDYRLILTGLRDYFAQENVPYYHRLRHEGYLRHLLVRRASKTGEILVALVTSSQTETLPLAGELGGAAAEEKLLQDVVALLQNLPYSGKLTGILHIVNDTLADIVQSDRTDVLYGQDFFYENLLDLRFRISVFSFFQTNSLGAEVLYSTAREFVGDVDKKDPVIFDLYSGTGTIAQLMAPAAGKVIGVEIVEEAVEAARKNAAENGLNNCEFIAGDVLKVLDSIEEKPDFIILDPPRDGIHPKALTKILRYGVERMVYISCKPTSLARDLEAFLAAGYRVDRAVCVDMFPGTANVETVVSLYRI